MSELVKHTEVLNRSADVLCRKLFYRKGIQLSMRATHSEAVLWLCFFCITAVSVIQSSYSSDSSNWKSWISIWIKQCDFLVFENQIVMKKRASTRMPTVTTLNSGKTWPNKAQSVAGSSITNFPSVRHKIPLPAFSSPEQEKSEQIHQYFIFTLP